MRIGELSAAEVSRRLGGEGLGICIGPFAVRLRCAFPDVAEAIVQLYADYPLPEDAFADFHVRLATPSLLRRWYRPQVIFYFDNLVPFKPLPRNQAFPFFEWGLNWCIAGHSHRYLILHAGVVERDGRAIVIPGPPGSGKSTLCAGLVARGWRLLSDELAMIDPGTLELIPVPRPLSLKNESIEVIREFAPGLKLGRAYAETNKGSVAHMRLPQETVDRAREPATPALVVLPAYVTGRPARLESHPPGQMFMYLADNAFNYNVLGTSGFQSLAAVVDCCRCYRLTYGDLDEATQILEQLRRGAGMSPAHAIA